MYFSMRQNISNGKKLVFNGKKLVFNDYKSSIYKGSRVPTLLHYYTRDAKRRSPVSIHPSEFFIMCFLVYFKAR